VRGHLTIVGLGGGALPVSFVSPPHECSVASPYGGLHRGAHGSVTLAQAGKIQMLVEHFPLERAGEAYRLLPRWRLIDAEWRLGTAATGLDRSAKQVHLANGEQVRYDLLLIATGVRARPWFNPAEAALDGVFSIRTRDHAARLRERLAAAPRRVLIIGAGFIGSEVASICRELGLAVTVAERGDGPLVGALGGVIGRIAAEMQRDHGVDLRTGVSVTSLEGDGNGRLRSASLSDRSTLEVDMAVVALGSIRNVEWLEGSGLAAGPFGVNIKSVGVPPFGDEIVFTQGSVKERCFAAAYGRRGRIVAAVTFDQGKWLAYYGGLIEQSAPFPPPPPGWDRPDYMTPILAEFPDPGVPTALPEVVLTGHDPSERRAEFRPRRR
jgi:hypothetical protein